MVNDWLKIMAVDSAARRREFAASKAARAHFRHDACVYHPNSLAGELREVVLAKPIHGLLRIRGGSFCRGKLTD
jgi:hypothetical protein